MKMKIGNFVWLMLLSGSLISAASNFVWACENTVQDIDGNIYNTVLIGTQCWMKENLKVRKNPSGSTITRHCYADDPVICDTDGGLYTWSTAMNGSTIKGAQGICPVGWHLPTDSEFKILVEGQATAGCESSEGWQCGPAGDRLKAAGDCHGRTPCGTSGFDGLLAGFRSPDGSFNPRGTRAYFWSSSVSGSNAWYRYLNSGYATVDRGHDTQASGVSVRCLKD